ncbi:MAG TPA: hypothetical protein VE155_03705 [Pseudonocardiaceae bacterium]|nr:hypothetical protein [Pseudonocardiaceae bacterium]
MSLNTDRRYSLPLYSIAEAARYLDVSNSTFQTWGPWLRAPPQRQTLNLRCADRHLARPAGRQGRACIGFAEGYVLT